TEEKELKCGHALLLPTPALKCHRYSHLSMLTLEDRTGAALPQGGADLALVDEVEKGRLPDVVVETKMLASPEAHHSETYLSIAIQVFIPFLIAGFGMVGAGLVLDVVQHWIVFEQITEIVILVPALLGLKGNLEMTLASRLSTQANLGHMDTPKQQWSMIVGNLTLIQCQAIVVGFLGSVVAIVMGGITTKKFDLEHALLLCAQQSCYSLSCQLRSRFDYCCCDCILPTLQKTRLASTCYNLRVYPSNPTVGMDCKEKQAHSGSTVYRLDACHGCHLISSVGGLILDVMVSRFEGIAVFQPVINGVGGNLVAVQASRISTALHRDAQLGTLADEDTVIFITPAAGFFGKGIHARTTRVLMLMVIPGHMIFIYTIRCMKAGHTSLTFMFVTVYLIAAMLQVAALLYIAYIMIHWMWKRKIDPDNSAIPYLTSLGDLLGISLLAIAFHILYLVGDGDEDHILVVLS
ncbi:hypothetical protein L9F63_023251, partial [Diploptera punctata]